MVIYCFYLFLHSIFLKYRNNKFIMIQEEVRLKNAHRNYAKYDSNSPPIHQGNNVYTQQKTKISYHPISNKELGYTND